MSTQYCAFPERLFEFAFNAEFVAKHAAVLVGAPDIPSQDAEKWLGYDAAFEIQQGPGVTGSLALQHKVPRKVDGPGSASNAHVVPVAGNTYFVFPLDADQFNIIQDLSAAQMPGIEFYFCAPLVLTRKDMNLRYAAKDLDAYSVFIDVSGAAPIDPWAPHSLVYSLAGNQAWVFSDDPRPLKIQRAGDRERRHGADQPFTLELVQKIYEKVFMAIDHAWPGIESRRIEATERNGRRGQTKMTMMAWRSRTMVARRSWAYRPQRVQFDDMKNGILATSGLLTDYLGLSWLVESAPQ